MCVHVLLIDFIFEVAVCIHSAILPCLYPNKIGKTEKDVTTNKQLFK